MFDKRTFYFVSNKMVIFVSGDSCLGENRDNIYQSY